jgi:hypothetical protein
MTLFFTSIFGIKNFPSDFFWSFYSGGDGFFMEPVITPKKGSALEMA